MHEFHRNTKSELSKHGRIRAVSYTHLAKLPIYAFFTAAFFPKHGALVMISLYVFGIVMGIVMALIFKKTAFKGEAVPFVMELPKDVYKRQG